MKLATVGRVTAAGKQAAARFPEVVACALAAGAGGVLGIDGGDTKWIQLLSAGSLGLPLFTALVLAAERHGWQGRTRLLADMAGFALLAALFFYFGRLEENGWAQRYAHLSATFHMTVAIAPYLGVREPWGFWQYNRSLFFRCVTATVFSGALFAGLALALAAVDNLLGIGVPDVAYGRLFFFVAFGLHPLIFLAGAPSDFKQLDAARDCPAGLRVFSQHVLLPLVALYVAILLAYMGKILVTGTWPSGWISYLVSGLAVVGIFSLLMVHPERMRSDRNWIDHYALAFWIAVLPSAGMVGMALWLRVQQYGITENRYMLGLLAAWLAGTAAHRVATRARDVKSIPLVLAVLGVATFAGPWSPYAVAERSQVGRIKRILDEHGVLDESALATSSLEIPFEEWQQVEEAVAYLVDYHGTDVIDAWSGGVRVAAGVLPAGDDGTASARIARVMARLGVQPGPSAGPVELRAERLSAAVPADGYALLAARLEDGSALVPRPGAPEAADTVRFGLSEDGRAIVMTAGGVETRAALSGLFDLAASSPLPVGDDAAATVEVAIPALALDVDGPVLDARLVLRRLRIEQTETGPTATEFDVAAVLLRPAAGAPPEP